jgi:hypothetical protein
MKQGMKDGEISNMTKIIKDIISHEYVRQIDCYSHQMDYREQSISLASPILTII